MLRLRAAGGLTAALFFLFQAAALAQAPQSSDIPDEDCFGCHSDFNGKEFSHSIHGQNRCVSCHSNITEIPHVEAALPPRSEIPTLCGRCHHDILKKFETSIHWKSVSAGKREAPVCTDCHGEHRILPSSDPASYTYHSSVSEKVCAQCHASERIVSKYHLPPDRVRTYMESYHGLVSRMGVQTVANCASCHGAHNILPSSDPSSSVNKKNLVQTCGKCHPNVSDRLAQGNVHTLPSTPSSTNVAFWIRVFYLFLIPLVIGGMLIHNALDFGAKLKAHYRRKRAAAGKTRFTRSEMIQHAVLTVSFVLLAYSGFALRYQDAWWALPFMVRSGLDWRGTLHRAAALVFSLLALYHLGYLLFSPRGRAQAKALALSFGDARDALGMVRRGQYSYIEKLEYWALVWGTVIMMLTGALLLYENWTMRYFPKWLIDAAGAIHFYEAVLATLAILVWHLYFTIFDPEHYPMNWSMVTGKEEEKEGKSKEE